MEKMKEKINNRDVFDKIFATSEEMKKISCISNEIDDYFSQDIEDCSCHQMILLDFAFTISKDTGLCFDYALVNDSLQHFSIDYVPCNGDIITIHCAPTVRADYYWFKHVRLAESIDQLIEYFENTRNV